jgi:hypothetical protein
MISTENFGLVGLDFWEVPLAILYMALIALWFAHTKSRRISSEPEYGYYLWGFYAKIAGGVLFTLVYYFYYRGGDTIAYFYSAVPLANLAKQDPVAYLHALFADNSMQSRSIFFTTETGYPYGYIYGDPLGYFMVKLISPLVIISFKSYLVTTVLVGAVTYSGVWKLFQTLCSYYPSIRPKLAFAVLFVPSCLFWGSGIIKDSFTFSAACWFVHGIDNLLIRKVRPASSLIGLFISGAIMVLLKPYIIMTLLPACMLWAAYARVSRIRNAAVRVIALPVLFVVLFFTLLVAINSVGNSFGKFSPERALHTVVVTQNDLKRGQYGSNHFDLGTIEPTWSSVLSKFPRATFAGMFRPQLIESRNVMMLVSGMENSLMLLFCLYILYRSRLVYFIALLRKNPLLQMCYVFAIGYAFMIGVTTPNFGALVRFKIPMLPLFISALFITAHILDIRRAVRGKGEQFQFADYVDGEPRRPPLPKNDHPQ